MRDISIAEVELERCNKWLAELRNLKLNASLSTILRKVKSLRVLRPSRPIKMSPDKYYRNKFCDFHQDHGHTTNECLTLKGQFDMLLKKGQLLEFLEKDGDHRREDARPSSIRGRDKVRIIKQFMAELISRIVQDMDYAIERGWGKT